MPRQLADIIEHLRARFFENFDSRHFDLYIEPELLNRDTQARSLAFEAIEQFIHDPSEHSLLISGNPGTGKTLTSHHIVKRQWQHYFQDEKNEYVPIWLWLPSISELNTEYQLMRESALLETVLKRGGLSKDEIQLLKQACQQKEKRLLVIVDGWDEIPAVTHNIYEKSGFWHPEGWLDIKVISLCRPEAFVHYEKRGGFRSIFVAPDSHQLPVLEIQPFNELKIKDYLNQLIQHPSEVLEATLAELPEELKANFARSEQYYQQMASISGVLEIVSTPFILSATSQVLPKIVMELKDRPPSEWHMTRYRIYEHFTQEWLGVQARRLWRENHDNRILLEPLSRGVPAEEKGRAVIEKLVRCLLTYSQRLARLALLKGQGKLDVVIQGQDALNPQLIALSEEETAYFSGIVSQKQMMLLRSGCLLQNLGDDTFRFLHKSLIEYFSAKEVFNSAHLAAETYAKNTLPEFKLKDEVTLNQYLLKDPVTVELIADLVQNHKAFKQLLYDVIELSKRSVAVKIAAANAITILNVAGEAFSGKDFRGIQIPGAILTEALCDETDFTGANLENVRFDRAWLRGTCFQHTCLKNIECLEEAHIHHTSKISAMALDPQEKWLLTGDHQNMLIQWDLTNRRILNRWHISASLKTPWDSTQSISNNLGEKAIASMFFPTWPVHIAVHPQARHTAILAADGKLYFLHYDSKKQRFAKLQGSYTIDPQKTVVMALARENLDDNMLSFFDFTGRAFLCFHPKQEDLLFVSLDQKNTYLWSQARCQTLRRWDWSLSVMNCALTQDRFFRLNLLSENNHSQLISYRLLTESRAISVETEIYDFEKTVNAIAISLDNMQCACLTEDQHIQIYHVNPWRLVQSWQVDLNHYSLQYSHDGNLLLLSCASMSSVSPGWDSLFEAWHIATGKLLLKKTNDLVPSNATNMNACFFARQYAGVYQLTDNKIAIWRFMTSFSNDSQFLKRQVPACNLVPALQNTLTDLDDVANNELPLSQTMKIVVEDRPRKRDSTETQKKWHLERHIDENEWQAFSGEFIIVDDESNGGGITTVLTSCDEQQSYAVITNLGVTAKFMIALISSFSKIGGLVETVGKFVEKVATDHTIHLIHLQTGQKYILKHQHCITSMVFSTDASWLVTGAYGVRLWETATGRQLHQYKDVGTFVIALALSPDKKYLAVSDFDKHLKLWQTSAPYQCLADVILPSWVHGLHFNETGCYLRCFQKTDPDENDEKNSFTFIVVAADNKTVSLQLIHTTMPFTGIELTQANINNAMGLSQQHASLFYQRGATGQPSPLSDHEVSERFSETHLAVTSSLTGQNIEYREPILTLGSQYSLLNPKAMLLLTYHRWTVALLRDTASADPEHVFLMLEGLDALGRFLYMRYDLATRVHGEPVQKGFAKIVIKANPNIDAGARRAVFKELLRKRDHQVPAGRELESIAGKVFSISRERALKLHAAIEAEGNKDEGKILYKTAGSQSFFSGAGENCYTWARNKLIQFGDDDIKKALPKQTSHYIAAIPLLELHKIQSSDTNNADSTPICRTM